MYKNIKFLPQISDLMDGNETDAKTVGYMRDMYNGCMDEGELSCLY